MERTKVRVTNTAFIIHPTREIFGTLKGFLERMYHYEFKKTPKREKNAFIYETKRELKEKWVWEFPKINEYRIHISYLEEFRRHFAHYDIEYTQQTTCESDLVDIPMQSFFSPRGEQGEWVKFLTTNPGRHLSLPATMGAGKTVTFLACCSAYGRRACAIIPPFLSDRWLLEIGKFTTLDRKEYVYISGSNMLKSYMTTLEEGRNPFKIVLFSINTIRNYIRDYYDNPEEWIYSPEELFENGRFGLRGIDEAHKELHFHYMLSMFLNLERYIGLSGTLDKENEFLNDMAARLFPIEGRAPVSEVEASTICSIYKMYFSGWLPKHKSPMGYSQVILENQIRFHPNIKKSYFLNLARILFAEFSSIKAQESDKCLVFMATTKLADEFTDFLIKHPDVKSSFNHLRIGRLRAGEPDEKCNDLDVITTTVGRAGTGTDVPGILTVLNTIAISDGPLSRQVLGRGRKRDDVECRYVRLYSPHIRKHVDYHLKSLNTLKDLVTKTTIKELPGAIPNPTPWDVAEASKMESMERKAKKSKKIKKRKTKK